MNGGALASGLASAGSWGAADLVGGMAAKRLPVLGVVAFAHVTGLVLVGVLFLALGEPLPSARESAFAAAAGVVGALGLVALYRALAGGTMGVAAPLSAVSGAVLPVAGAWWLAGLPSWRVGLACALALAGVALVTLDKVARPPSAVLRDALLAGAGLGAFLLIMGAATGTSVLGALLVARLASTAVMVALAWRAGALAPAARDLKTVALVGALDVGGNLFYVLAARLGPLDTAVMLSSLYPLGTVVLARFVLGERLRWLQAVGALLMLASLPLFALG